ARFNSFRPIDPQRIIQIGVRHVDPEEELLLQKLSIVRISSDELERLPDALAQLTRRTKQLYVHLDADVLDESEGAANSYACAGGLTKQELNHALRLIADTGSIAAASITSYDPAADTEGRIADALLEAASILAA